MSLVTNKGGDSFFINLFRVLSESLQVVRGCFGLSEVFMARSSWLQHITIYWPSLCVLETVNSQNDLTWKFIKN